MTDGLGSLSWQSLLSSLEEETVVIGLDYRICCANQALLGRIGLSLADVEGKLCYEVFRGGTSPCNESDGGCPLQGCIETGEPYTVIHRRLRDGYRYYVEIEARPLKDADGQLIGILSASQELGRSERFERIFETSLDGVLVSSLSGRMVDVNPSLCRMLGYSREELAERNVVDFIGEEMAVALREKREDGEGHYTEVNVPRKDGSSFAAEIAVTLLPLGPVTLYVALVRDITSRKLSEQTIAEQAQALTVSETQYRSIFNNAGDAMLVIEDDTTVAMVNCRFEEITGYPREKVEGKVSFLEFLPEEVRQEALEGHRRRREHPYETLPRYQIWGVTKGNQRRLFEISGSMIPGTKRSLIALRDTTEDHYLKEQILRRNREAELLYSVASLVSRCNSLDATLQGVMDKVIEHTNLSRGYIFLLDDDQQKLFVRASKGSSANDPAALDRTDLWQGFAGWVVKTGEPLFVRYAHGDPLLPATDTTTEELQTLACVPVTSSGKTFGAMGLSGKDVRDYSREEQRLLTSIGSEIGVAVERAQLLLKSQQRTQELETLMSMTREMASTLDLHEILDRTLAIVCQQIGASTGFISLLDEDKRKLTTKAFWGQDAATSRKAWKSRVGEGVIGWVAQHHQGIVCDNVFADPRIQQVPGADLGYHSIVAVPLKTKDKLLGVIAAVSKETAAFTGADLRLLSAYAAETSMALQNALLLQEMRRQASTDDLTHLTNRRYFYLRLEEELKRARRYGHPVSLLFLDVDDLKHINDRYGHLQGDQLLRHVAALLTSVLRSTDVAARYGGDEFVILLPETGREEGASAAERLLRESTPCPLVSGGSIPWQMSIGVAWLPVDGNYDLDLLKMADEAVYRAKEQGSGWDYARMELRQAHLPLDGG